MEKLESLIKNAIDLPVYLKNNLAKKIVFVLQQEDVAPVRHGKWVWYEEPHSSNIFIDYEFEYGWVCSCCDKYADHNSYTADDYDYKPELEYCPHCGAKMDLEE